MRARARNLSVSSVLAGAMLGGARRVAIVCGLLWTLASVPAGGREVPGVPHVVPVPVPSPVVTGCWADVRLFALTWGAGFVFTLVFFS